MINSKYNLKNENITEKYLFFHAFGQKIQQIDYHTLLVGVFSHSLSTFLTLASRFVSQCFLSCFAGELM